LFPKVLLSANVQDNLARLNVNNSSYSPVAKPQGAALLRFEWPLYEGGLRQNKLSLAQSKREEAAAALQERTNQALREVALAYDQVDTGAPATRCRHRPADCIRGRLPQRQRRLRARGRHTDRRHVRADRARDSARRGGRAHTQSLINAAARLPSRPAS
jgi:Outer membrane efflux protein